MFSFLKKLFARKKKDSPVKKTDVARENVIEPDFIDYDGMGNQGRFPKPMRKK